MKPTRLIIAALVAACLASCAAPDGPRDGGDGGTAGTCAVRSDLPPITRRFPLFGTPTRAHWCGVVLNGGDRLLPISSEVRMVGVVELTGPAFARVVATMGGSPVFEAPEKLPGELTGFLPRHATWLRSAGLDQWISGGLYTASFYVDRAHRTVLMDCLNPVPATGEAVVLTR